MLISDLPVGFNIGENMKQNKINKRGVCQNNKRKEVWINGHLYWLELILIPLNLILIKLKKKINFF